jgi:hypothetical protein
MSKRLFEDTDEKAEQILVELARKTPIWKKFRQVSDTSETVRAFALAGLKRRYPHASEKEIRLRLAALFLDRDTVIKVYGWDPEKEGY